ncbi:hypothetical protein [Paenibacillus bovis]|uniref:hypothetical protein n=1 Tax=Paenibacillus bovis TaxID=1616788 RepID=UPI000B0386AD|nr:hypothetical protein [Paenibacillus bovis]
MYETKFDPNFKKIMITVNGEPVGDGLLIDRVTYAPVRDNRENIQDSSSETAQMI